MNEIKLINDRPIDPILCSTPKVISSTNTLCRVIQLHRFFENEKDSHRNEIVAAMIKIWNGTLVELYPTHSSSCLDMNCLDINGIKKRLESQLSETPYGAKVFEFYSEQISNTSTIQIFRKCLSMITKDLAMINMLDIQETTRGANGPTHIVSYSRFSKKQALAKQRNFVVKWTRWNEICSTYLYEIFSQKLTRENQLSPFLVPKIAAVDFERQICALSHWSHEPLEQKTTDHLRQSFHTIAGKSKRPKDAQIMLLEKINGSNMLDFIETKYELLNSEQKQALFEKMGQLAILDLWIGNTDRLIKLCYKGQYTLQAISSANFGNLMIRWDVDTDQMLELYAIDNGVDLQLISNERHKSAYRKFLNSYLDDPTPIESLAACALACMREAIQIKIQTSTPDTKKKLFAFQKDLEDLDVAKPALTKGISDMFTILKESLPAFWDGEEAVNIKNYLKENCPELLEAVSAQFEAIKK